MKAKKLISTALAVMLAFCTLAFIPASSGISTAITADAEYYASLPQFRVIPGNRSVSLSWKAVNGTKTYYVYYRENGESEYEFYTDTLKTECKFANLDSGTVYDFMVYALDEDYEILAVSEVINVIPSAKNNSYENGFVISTDTDGLKYVSAYTGIGGNIKIPTSVSYIGFNAFYGNTDITSVTVPSSCNFVGESAFRDCTKLKKVVFEGSVSLSKYVFQRCFNLETVEFKKSMLNIDDGAFRHCQSLKKVIINESKGNCSIGAAAFYGCISLESITIPKNCTEINPLAFANCFKLTKITVPSSTKFTYSGDNAHIGYFYAAKTLSNAWRDIYYLSKADGKTAVYYDTLSNRAISNLSVRSGNMYLSMEKYTPVKVTMVVTKGSNAEKYAKKYGIAYEYASGNTSSSSALSAPENFRASKKSTTSITLAWDAVEGADAYAVYMYNSKTKKYEKYKTVQNTKCVVSDLTKGTAYKFKIAALSKVNGKYKTGPLSDPLTVSTKKSQ